jgi:glycerol uptake facilitator-like aquaporin
MSSIGHGHATTARHRSMNAGMSRRLIAERLGTAFLLATVVGSGIMADRLFENHQGLGLLANSLATGAALATLIFTFGPVSGAHFNPVVTFADAACLLRWLTPDTVPVSDEQVSVATGSAAR